MKMVFVSAGRFIGGGAFTDAGGWVWDGHRFKHVPGWNPEGIADLASMARIMGAAAQLKVPGVGDAVAKALTQAVEKELGEHVQGGGVVVIGA